MTKRRRKCCRCSPGGLFVRASRRRRGKTNIFLAVADNGSGHFLFRARLHECEAIRHVPRGSARIVVLLAWCAEQKLAQRGFARVHFGSPKCLAARSRASQALYSPSLLISLSAPNCASKCPMRKGYSTPPCFASAFRGISANSSIRSGAIAGHSAKDAQA
jgi:hypothetical protein